MKSIEIGKSAVVASQAALGVMRMDALDADAAAEVVRTAAEHGVNFFDTADIYGFNVNHDHASSRVLGRAWKDAGLKREDIFLQTKFGINIDFSDPNNVHATRYDFSAKHLITRLDEELEALGTDYVDFALLHRPDTLMEAEEIVEAFTTLHKAGKVRHFGVSNVNPWQAELLQSWLGDDPAMRLEASQLQFGLMHAQMVSDELMTNSGAEGMVVANHSDGLLSYSRLRHMTIQAWSPFQSGTEYGPFVGNEHFPELNKALDEKAAKYGVSANAIATAWVLRHPAKIQIVLGSMNPTRLGEMLDGADIESLASMSKIFKGQSGSFYVDFEGVTALTAQLVGGNVDPQVEAALSVLAMFEDLEAYGTMKGGTAVVNMTDKEQNSFKTVCDKIGELIRRYVPEVNL